MKNALLTGTACALLVAALLPAASAELNQRSFWDKTVRLYPGWGIYDPFNPENDCLAALMGDTAYPAGAFYYDNARVFPMTEGTGVELPGYGWIMSFYGTPLEDCYGQFDEPNQALHMGPTSAGAGSAVRILSLLGPDEVANLHFTVVGVEYCRMPSSPATPGPPLFSTWDVECGDLGSHTFPDGCLTLTTSPGVLEAEEPILLSPGPLFGGSAPCNRQVGAPGMLDLAFVSEFCISTTTFNIVTGMSEADEDTDWFLDQTTLTTPDDVLWMAQHEPDLSPSTGMSDAC